MRNPEKIPETEKETSVLDEKDFQELIRDRQIVPEDFEIIKKLSHYPKDLFIGLHNFFGFEAEKSAQELERHIKYLQEEAGITKNEARKSFLEKKMAFYSLMLEFVQRYDWTAALHLERVFERRKIKEQAKV